MKAEQHETAMAPAFKNNTCAALFSLFLFALILLPVGLKQLGLPSRRNLYNGLSPTLGAKASLDETLYQSPTQSDVVMLGSSNMVGGFPPGAVEAYFSKQLGRPAVVEYLVRQYSGPDKQYLLLADYLKTHRTGLIVAALPWRTYASTGPSHDLNTMLRYGEYENSFQQVSTLDRVRIYSEQVIAGPRQLLTQLRDNQPFAETTDDVKRSIERGYDGPFLPDDLQAPSNAKPILLDCDSPQIKSAQPSDPEYDYAALFYRKIADLAAQHQTPFVPINFPEFTDYDSAEIPVNLSLITAFLPGQKVMAISPKDLFGSISKERYRHFFRDDVHLNANGARLFDSVALPVLFDQYRQGRSLSKT